MRGWNKKGAFVESSEIAYFLGTIVLLTIFFFIFAPSISVFANEQNPVPKNLNPDIVAARIVNNCFANEIEEIELLEPGILDLEKINDQTLRNCFKQEDSYDFVRVQLTYDGMTSPIDVETLGRTKSEEVERIVLVKDELGNEHVANLVVIT